MTTYLNNYYNPIYATSYNDYYNGTVYITSGDFSGTGALLYDGRTILTAAHVADETPTNRVSVYFDTAYGVYSIEGTITMHPWYDAHDLNYDVATITLDEHAPITYQRYDLYRDDDEIGEDFVMVGYGDYGSGSRGEVNSNNYLDDLLKLKVQNSFESDFYDISQVANLDWQPLPEATLVADFDSGYSSEDALGGILDINDLGLGAYEGMIASGDSGGPAFLDGKVAGVASYSATIGDYDINNFIDSSFGELGAWQRVSYYAEWIDEQVVANYENAPESKAQASAYVSEPIAQIDTAYFYLEIDRDILGMEAVSFSYTTADGTAQSGEEYVAQSGTISFDTYENSAVIGVEILKDIDSDEEMFFLELTSESDLSFGENVEKLVAAKIIAEDANAGQQEYTSTYFTTANYMYENFGMSMSVSYELISTYIGIDVGQVYDVLLQTNINNDMLADMYSLDYPEITGEFVSDFFDYFGFEGSALGFYSDEVYLV